MDDIDTRIRVKAQRGEFLGQLLALSRVNVDIQDDFIAHLSALATTLREIFERHGLIRRFTRTASAFWSSVSGRTVAFIDGGVARIDLPSVAPMGIRVGSYAVTIGDSSEARESFATELTLVDELFSNESWTFEDVFEDTLKMMDAARIIGEAAGVLKQLRQNPALSAVFLHGPLVNPVAPYGTPGFPGFSNEAARLLFGDKDKDFATHERHFVVLYRLILEEIASASAPVIGVVERSVSRHPAVLFGHIEALQETGNMSPDDAQKLRDGLYNYRLNDAAVIGVMLGSGEYLAPVAIDRQQPSNKWPRDWYAHIQVYPRALSTYIKSSDESEPFRVEMHEGAPPEDWVLEMVYQTARLLPRYGFPVGLDIVDKYAKVPNWMSKSVRGEHAAALLRNALRSGDPHIVDYAKKVLIARGRDWLFRPKP